MRSVHQVLHRCFLALIALLASIAIARADERAGFYRMLVAMEQRAVDAVRARSASELQSIHNDIMYDVVGGGAGRWKPDAQCWSAYMHLSIPVLFYASAINPAISTPVRSEAKNISMIIVEEALSDFKYKKIVSNMCLRSREERFSTFSDVKAAVSAGQFEKLSFSIKETRVYRKFSEALIGIIASIEQSTKYERDNGKIILGLEAIYRRSMLEEYVPDVSSLARVFLQGSFTYWKNNQIETEVLQNFLSMLKSLQADKQSIVLENLLTRLDAVQRTKPKSPLDDDIPF